MRIAVFGAAFLAASVGSLYAQAPATDEATMQIVEGCGSCHGVNGVSIADGIPNLAGQKAAYIVAQLKAFKGGSRANPVMQGIASQLEDAEMEQVAAYFSGLDLAAGAPNSEANASLGRADFPFPENYHTEFTKYHTIEFPAPRNQVRHYWANDVALEAARAGQPLPDGSYILVEIFPAKLDADGKPIVGADGAWETEPLSGYTAMAREAGWGDAIPGVLRNENWVYAAFRTDKTQNPGAALGTCYGCHVPLTDTSYTFTLDQLKSAQ
jgi:cytochrome c553